MFSSIRCRPVASTAVRRDERLQDRDDDAADRQHCEEQADGGCGAHPQGWEYHLANDVEAPMVTA